MDETAKRITKRMSPKENGKRRKEECSVFLSHRKENRYGKGFPYGERTLSAFIRD